MLASINNDFPYVRRYLCLRPKTVLQNWHFTLELLQYDAGSRRLFQLDSSAAGDAVSSLNSSIAFHKPEPRVDGYSDPPYGKYLCNSYTCGQGAKCWHTGNQDCGGGSTCDCWTCWFCGGGGCNCKAGTCYSNTCTCGSCSSGQYRAGCSGAGAGYCTGCSGLGANRYWTTDGGMSDSCGSAACARCGNGQFRAGKSEKITNAPRRRCRVLAHGR